MFRLLLLIANMRNTESEEIAERFAVGNSYLLSLASKLLKKSDRGKEITERLTVSNSCFLPLASQNRTAIIIIPFNSNRGCLS